MAVNPFDARYELEYNPQTHQGTVYDRYRRDLLHLQADHYQQLAAIRSDRAQQQAMAAMMGSYMSGLGGLGGYSTRAPESVKDKLLRTNYERWRRRMLRIREKVWVKRMGHMANIGWYMACGWGAIIATMFSIKLFEWLMRMILGS